VDPIIRDALTPHARVKADSSRPPTPPVALFQTRIVRHPIVYIKHQYAVSRDGRFLIDEPVEESTATPITLILHWRPRP
jgi:hypothetical protein